MSETNILWPESLGCPLRRAYVGEANTRFMTTEVADGPPRFRLIDTDERRAWSVAFAWTWEQLQVFEGFVASDLSMGLNWFRMNQLTGQGMTEHFCHLVGDYGIRSLSGSATHYEVEFQVEAFRNWYEVPPVFVMDNPFDAGVVTGPLPVDIIDGREASDPRPPNRVDALVPGA